MIAPTSLLHWAGNWYSDPEEPPARPRTAGDAGLPAPVAFGELLSELLGNLTAKPERSV